MTIYFITDINPEIGAGHAMRCLSIAHACREKGMRTVFLVSDEVSADGLRKLTSADLCLTPDEVVVEKRDKGTGAMSCFSEPDAQQIPSAQKYDIAPVPLSRLDTPAVLLLDTYALDADYAHRLRKHINTEDGSAVSGFDNTGDGSAVSGFDNTGDDSAVSGFDNTGDGSAVSGFIDTENRSSVLSVHDLKIAKIDDFGEADFPADIIINYMPDAKNVHYTEADLVLAGLSYAPLRPQFTCGGEAAQGNSVPGLPSTASSPEQALFRTGGYSQGLGLDSVSSTSQNCPVPPLPRILVSTGGADWYSMRASLTAMIERDFPEVEIVLADGSVSDMASLMRESTLAVTAGGSTVIELCAVGTPAVVFTVADNQLPQVRSLAAQGAISFAGSIGDGTPDYADREKELVLKNITTQIRTLLNDEDAREKMSQKMRALVDGRGAARIASALQNA